MQIQFVDLVYNQGKWFFTPYLVELTLEVQVDMKRGSFQGCHCCLLRKRFGQKFTLYYMIRQQVPKNFFIIVQGFAEFGIQVIKGLIDGGKEGIGSFRG